MPCPSGILDEGLRKLLSHAQAIMTVRVLFGFFFSGNFDDDNTGYHNEGIQTYDCNQDGENDVKSTVTIEEELQRTLL